MATRLYLSSSAFTLFSPVVQASWEQNSSGFTRYSMETTHQNTALADVTEAFGSAATGQTCYRQFIMARPFDVYQLISNAGTYSMVIRGREQTLSTDLHLALCLRVLAGTTGVARGLLVYDGQTHTEFATTDATRILSATSITTSIHAWPGDYLCAEVGFHGVTPANGESGTLRFGDPTGTADFALTSGLTTDLVPWIELSQTLTFGQPNGLISMF